MEMAWQRLKDTFLFLRQRLHYWAGAGDEGPGVGEGLFMIQ
jgi:hypothetical protein